MKTIEQLWESYSIATVPQGASPVQRRETQLAFYAGASTLLFSILGDDDFNECKLEELYTECKEFAQEVINADDDIPLQVMRSEYAH